MLFAAARLRARGYPPAANTPFDNPAQEDPALSDLTPVLSLQRCTACFGPQSETINGWMRAGIADTEISRRLAQAGTPLSRISLGNHRRKHLSTKQEQMIRAAKKQLTVEAKAYSTSRPKDIAPLVRDVVYGRIESGELEPTVSEGLRAQEMIDRRFEKAADIEMQLILASVLGGGSGEAYIEGEAVEVVG